MLRGFAEETSDPIVVDHKTGTASTGDYEDLVVKTPDGWWIKHRICFFRYPSLEEAAKRREAARAAERK